MYFLSAIFALFCIIPQDVPNSIPPPPKQATVGLENELPGFGLCADTFDQRLRDTANALKLGQQAAEESDDTKAKTLYGLAIDAAFAAGESRISHEFALEMTDRLEVPPEFLPNWHMKAIELSRNEARIAELAWLMLEDVEALEPSDSIGEWESSFKALRELAADAESEHTKRNCGVVFESIKAWLWIAKESSKGSSIAKALRLILSGDVRGGIQQLAKSRDKALAKIAQQTLESETPFSNAHQQLLEQLAESGNTAAKLSGQKIFESLVPELTKEQIETCQPICFQMTEQLPLREDFSLPYHGFLKNGYHPSAKEKTIPKGFTFNDKEKNWSVVGNSTVEWPRMPFENYVQEMELSIGKIDKQVKLAFGSEDSVQVRFYKKDDKIMARLIRHSGGRYNWKGSRTFAIGEKLIVKVYRTPERMFAFINGKKLSSRYFGLGWHKFRISVEGRSRIKMSSIKSRPWLPGDREVLKKLVGDHRSIDMTALQFHPPTREDYKKYLQAFDDLKGIPTTGESFVTDQEILMRPVAAGKFTRPGDGRKVFISKDFHCSAHEITQRQFSEIMEFNPASTQGNAHLPVDNVTMAEAISFCEKLTETLARQDLVPEGYEYRLPTEAEWTLAAMADGKSDMDVPAKEFWNWDTCEGGFRMVGTSTASDRGLYDMHGNVEELTLSQYHKRKATKEELEELVDPASVPTAKSHIVVKGGSWNLGVHMATASRRERRHQGRTPGRGFRVVLAPVLE